MPTVSMMGLSLSISTFVLPVNSSEIKLTLKDMVAAELEGVKEIFVKDFEDWLKYQSVMVAVKIIFPNMPPLKKLIYKLQ